ncbi:MAG: SRPBCC family protein [Acidimicrobiales bacterium]
MIKGPPVEVEVRIEARPEVVFPYLVEPDQLVRWMGEEADIDVRPGGQFWLRVQGDDIAIGEYVSLDPPNQVVISWGWDGSADVPPGSSTVTFDLRPDGPDGEATVLSLTHADLPSDWCDRHREGWTHHLAELPTALSETS